jgi:cysteinyl-tRNA synthetase
MADLRFQPNPDATVIGDDYFEQQQKLLLIDLENDLATPAALAKLEQIADHLALSGIHPEHSLPTFYNFLQFLDDVFGLGLLISADINHEQKQLIRQRETARQQQDWRLADELRDELAEQGIELNDTPMGAVWRRT